MSKLYLTWEYDFSAPYDDIVAWCTETIENDWTVRGGTFFFYTPEDLLIFKLRWSSYA